MNGEGGGSSNGSGNSGSNSSGSNSGGGSSGGSGSNGSTQSLINPLTGLNVQIPTKKVKTATPCAISPVLLECPEQDCSKKYKHANGLKYHQSHAHGAGSMDEDSQQPPESPRAAPPTTPSPAPATPQPVTTTTVQCQSIASTSPPVQTTSSVPSSTIPTSTVSISSISQPAPQQQPTQPSTPTPSLPLPASIPIQSINTGLLTTVTLPPGIVQNSSSQPSPMQTHPVAGGSITTGIASAAMQHQQQLPQPLIVSSNANIIGSQGIQDPSLSPLPTSQLQPQSQPQSLVNNIVQTPTRPDTQGTIHQIGIFIDDGRN